MASLLLFPRKIAIVFTGMLLALVITFAGGPGLVNPPAPENADTLVSQFSIFSDVHMETFETYRYRGFADCLRGVPRENNTLVLLGDNTMNGQTTEYLGLYGLLNLYGPKSLVVAPGNHDVRINYMMGGTDTIEKGNQRHMDFYGSFTNTKLDNPYYSKQISGATLIVVANEQAVEGEGAYFSEAQMQWLTSAVEKASDERIFVFSHDPLPGTFGQSFYSSADSSFMNQLLASHGDAYFVSGHIHPTVAGVRFIDRGTHKLVLAPALMSGQDHHSYGLGFHVEIYDDEVLFRLRDFSKGEWIDGKAFRF